MRVSISFRATSDDDGGLAETNRDVEAFGDQSPS